MPHVSMWVIGTVPAPNHHASQLHQVTSRPLLLHALFTFYRYKKEHQPLIKNPQQTPTTYLIAECFVALCQLLLNYIIIVRMMI